MTYAAACTERLRLGCVVFASTLYSPVHLAKCLQHAGGAKPGPDRDRRGHRRAGPAVRRVRGGPAPVRGPVHRRPGADEGAVDRAAGHVRRRVLATARGHHGTQAGPEAAPTALDRRQRPGRAAPRGPAGRRVLRRGLHPHRDVRRAGHHRAPRRWPRRAWPRSSAWPSGCTSRWTTTRSGPGPGPNAALERLYGRRSEQIEAAAIAGNPDQCAAGLRAVADAGAELILCTALFDQAGDAERLATEVLPQLG